MIVHIHVESQASAAPARQPFENVLLKLAEDKKYISAKRPEHFIEVMKKNNGGICAFSPYGSTEDGLERRNPIIAAMGDSVTAGRFGWLLTPEEREINYQKLIAGDFENAVVNVEEADVLHGYAEIFRRQLVEHYRYTCVSVINGGIAGDSMKGMFARHERDILCHCPDLVLINGALNWDEHVGSIDEFHTLLTKMVRDIKASGLADIILITPNGIANVPSNREAILVQCVESIREIAKCENTCLADVYALWEDYRSLGYPWEPLLANGMNHPVRAGHEAYAKVLMNLCRE